MVAVDGPQDDGLAMQRLGYVPALDGVRGVAILLVISTHFFGVAGGTTGVDVFFALSGFLISTLLLEERTFTGGVDLHAFYIRRVRRLFPALAMAIVVYLVATEAAGEDHILVALLSISYATNVLLAVGRSIFQGTGLIHLWSLAQEEQFYLVWPLVLLFVARSRRAFAFVLLGYLLLSGWRAGLWIHGAPTYRIYYGPDTRATALIAGSALAIWRYRRGLNVGEWAGQAGAGLLLAGAVFGWAVAFWPTVGEPVFELGVILLLAAALSDTSIARGLAKRPLVWIGERSYSLYLWQMTLGACRYVFGVGALATFVALTLAFLCAALSYRFVEKRFRRSGAARDRRQSVEPVLQS